MSTILFLETLIDELHKMLNSFWWRHSSDPKKWVKWETWESLCKHKRVIWVFVIFIFLILLCWESWVGEFIINQIPYLAVALRPIIFRMPIFSVLPLKKKPYYTWCGIHTTCDLVRWGTHWKDGDKVQVWRGQWINDYRSFQLDTPPVHDFEDMVIKDFYTLGTRRWDVELVMEVFSEENMPGYLRRPHHWTRLMMRKYGTSRQT